jgi:ATP-dependent Clp protease ATP-binding subunit ClpA
VLLDEVEKAHPDVFHLLLQVLDDGRLTDGKGRQVNFKNTIIIMTSNIGSDMILDWGKRRGSIGFADQNEKEVSKAEDIRNKVMELLRDHFRPEFLNRVDEIVMFQALVKADLAQIVDLQLASVVKRLQQKKITLTFTDKARKLVADKGYDPSFGARPLKRAIQDLILDELALKMIKHEIKEGDADATLLRVHPVRLAGREESARKLLDALTRLCTLAQGGLDASADDAPPPRPRLTIVPKDPL